MIKIWSIFNFFGPVVWIVQDGKQSNPVRSDAYFPEWKSALKVAGCQSLPKDTSANFGPVKVALLSSLFPGPSLFLYIVRFLYTANRPFQG